MNVINDLFDNAAHRSWELPGADWKYYQEWNNALFLHWVVPVELIRPLIPPGLQVDEVGGVTYVSLVAFTMEQIRPRYLPSFPPLSNFHEINLRAYVNRDDKPGVYFLNIEAGNLVSAIISRTLSGLPYENSVITRKVTGHVSSYHSENKRKAFFLNAEYTVTAEPVSKTSIDNWLTERYCLYLDRGRHLYRFEVHHKPWNLKKIIIKQLQLRYQVGRLTLDNHPPDLVHYADGVQVIAWPRETIGGGGNGEL